MLKRLFNITVSFAGLVVLSPLLLAIAALIKLDSKGPIFYRGERIGRFGKPFTIYKFRTMVVDADKLGGPSTAADALDTLLQTAKLLQDKGLDGIHFLLVGDGSEKGKLMEKAEDWGVRNLSFYEAVPKNSIQALLRAIDIAVVTKRKTKLYEYGTSFIKTFDYMVCAKPVVWAVDSVNNPVAEANCGIMVPPEDAEEMAKAIMELCDFTDAERREMGMRGYDYVMKYHSLPVLADRLLEAMEDARQSAQPPRSC